MDQPQRPPVGILTKFLQANPSVQFLRYQYLDVGNVLRLIVVTKQHALALGDKPLKVSCLTFGFLPDDSFNLTRFAPAGYDELYPDWQSLRVCTYLNNGETNASVMCFVKELSRNFPVWKRDPRTLLQQALQRAEENYQMQFLVGFEVEFVLLDNTNRTSTRPVETLNQFYGAAAVRDDRVMAVLEECMRSLLSAGINATHFHSEIGQGMFEIPTGPLRALDAIDALVYSKEAIQTIANRHGFTASCYPKPVPTPSHLAVGGHVHFSIDNATQENADHFLAGILSQLPALCAFSMASVDSYHRLGGMRGTIGSWVGWGTEDKDVAVRKISGRVGYWEIRCADQTANMYYTLAAWITAGCAGVEAETALRWKDPPSKESSFIREIMTDVSSAHCSDGAGTA